MSDYYTGQGSAPITQSHLLGDIADNQQRSTAASADAHRDVLECGLSSKQRLDDRHMQSSHPHPT